MVLEAKARIIANDIAEKEIARQKNAETRPKPVTTGKNGFKAPAKFTENLIKVNDSIDRHYEEAINRDKEEPCGCSEADGRDRQRSKNRHAPEDRAARQSKTDTVIPAGSLADIEKQVSELEGKLPAGRPAGYGGDTTADRHAEAERERDPA